MVRGVEGGGGGVGKSILPFFKPPTIAMMKKNTFVHLKKLVCLVSFKSLEIIKGLGGVGVGREGVCKKEFNCVCVCMCL